MKTSHLIFPILLLLCFACNSTVDAQTKTIFLVRHAEKIDDQSPNPNLSPQGLERSERLANMLLNSEVEFIYSTDYNRTIQTGLPLSKMIGKEVKKYNPRDSTAIDKILEETGSSRVLIIGHSNTIPGIVNQLIDEQKYPHLEEMEYDKLFIVSISGDESDCIVITF